MAPVTCIAPTRIDLAGGTLDLWPLYLVVAGCATVNLAIDRHARATVNPRDDARVILRSADLGATVEAPSLAELPPEGDLPLLRAVAREAGPATGFELVTRSGVPPGSGLGGSSSLAVAALRALSIAAGSPLSPPRLVVLARDLEARMLGVPTGTQDHFAAASGGLSLIELIPGGPRRRRLRADAEALSRRLVLVLVGSSRLSADTNWRMLRAALDGDAAALEAFRDIAAAARRLRDALTDGDHAAAAEAMAADYEARRGLVPGVETGEMRRAREAALDAGALAGKVCGAGGGGAMVFLVPPGRKSAVSAAAAAAGARPLGFRPDREGVRP